jgi:Lon protease-like protein
MQLPLHIFEPRYRLMIRRCLEGDQTFGVALIAGGHEGESGTIPAGAGCSAEIIEATPFPDGRINLQTVGRRRFRILSTREEDDYLIGTVEWLDDQPSGPAAVAQSALVRRSLHRYLESLARNADLKNITLDDLDEPDDPYALSMWVAALTVLPDNQKQELLELTSTEERLELEYGLLQRAEVVQRAFARRVAEMPPPSPDDDPSDPFDQFQSLN